MIKTKFFSVKIYKIPFPFFWTKIIESKKEPKNQQALFQINSCSHTNHQQNEIFMCMNKGGKCCVNTSHQNTLNQTKLQLKCLNNHFLCFYYVCNFFYYTKDLLKDLPRWIKSKRTLSKLTKHFHSMLGFELLIQS